MRKRGPISEMTNSDIMEEIKGRPSGAFNSFFHMIQLDWISLIHFYAPKAARLDHINKCLRA